MLNSLGRAFAPEVFPGWNAAVLAFFAGVLGGVGQAPLGFWPLALIGFAFVCRTFAQLEYASTSAWTGWIFGSGYFATTIFWIVEPFFVDPVRHGWMAPFALLFLAGGLAALWAVAFWLAAKCRGARLLSLIVFWTTIELLRTYLFTGFPWALIGHIWIESPVISLAAWIGPNGLTLLFLFIAALPSFFTSVRNGLGLAFLLTMGLAGGCYWQAERTETEFTNKLVRIVQPNAAQHLKWDPDMLGIFFGRQLAMTGAEADQTPDLVLWPETAVGYLVEEDGLVVKQIAEQAQGAPVLFGAVTRVDDRYYNSALMVSREGALSASYFKHHLVPFGEYVPLSGLLSRFGAQGLAERHVGGYARGPGPTLIDIPGLGPALPLICYEIIFPRNVRTTDRPAVLLNMTNDAWFGKISGPYQHLAQSRLRAVETGLPVLRAANTGVSAVIDPHGNIVRQIPLERDGYLDEFLPTALPPTLYYRTGDLVIYALLMMALIGIVAKIRTKRD